MLFNVWCCQYFPIIVFTSNYQFVVVISTYISCKIVSAHTFFLENMTSFIGFLEMFSNFLSIFFPLKIRIFFIEDWLWNTYSTVVSVLISSGFKKITSDNGLLFKFNKLLSILSSYYNASNISVRLSVYGLSFINVLFWKSSLKFRTRVRVRNYMLEKLVWRNYAREISILRASKICPV